MKTDSMAAYELLRAQPGLFDLVITDQAMPRMTGMELAQHSGRTRPELPVILYSGYSNDLPQDTAAPACVRAVLRKPVEVPALRELIETLLNG